MDVGATAVDVGLFKAIGLYQLLRPGTRYRVAMRALLLLAFALHSTQLFGLYFAAGDLQRFINIAALVVCGTLCVYKGHVMVANVDRIWDTLHVAGYEFVTCAGRDESELRRAGALVRVVLRAFVVISYQTLAIWTAVPWLTDDHDGTAGARRMTINNLWTPLPVAVYNAPPVWAAVYATEVFLITVNVFCWALFDCYLVTMCFVLNAQFHTIAAAYEKLAWSSPPQRHSG